MYLHVNAGGSFPTNIFNNIVVLRIKHRIKLFILEGTFILNT